MANARTRFDTIRDYMVRSHSATSGTLYGKPCALLNGHAFIYFHQEWAAFLLKGRVRLQALALPGARFWDPLGREGASMDWVIVPDTHFLRWDRLAIEAVKIAHTHSQGRRPVAGPAEGPPPLPPAANRWINSIKSLFAKAAHLSLAHQEELPEKPISRIFAETGADLNEQDASAVAALAESATSEAAVPPADPVGDETLPPAVPQGRASFIVDDPEPAATPVPTGRASFVIDEPAAEIARPNEEAEVTTPDPVPPAAPVVDRGGGRASFQIEPLDDAPAPASSGRASFAVADEPPEPPAPPEAAAGAAAEPKPDSVELRVEEVQAPPVITGRASFNVASDPQPEAPKAAPSSMGRASFSIDDSEPGAPAKPPGTEGAASSAVDTDSQSKLADAKESAEGAAAPSWALASDDDEVDLATSGPAEPQTAEADAWAEKISNLQLEASEDIVAPTPIIGRAVFGAREPEPLPSVEPKFKIKLSDKPMGRASFLIADDPPDGSAPATTEEESDGLDYEPPTKD